MQVLAFSDLHGDVKRLELLLSTKVDLYLSAGDLAQNRDELIRMFRLIGRRHFFMVPGNNELPEWIPGYMNLHGEKKVFMGVVFGGLGGSPRTPFNTIFEWEEDYAYEVLERVGYVDVFVAHAPPKSSRLSLTKTAVDAGSEAVRWYIEEYAPLVAVVGHIHEREGIEEKIGGTTVLNPGKRGAIIDLQGGQIRILWL